MLGDGLLVEHRYRDGRNAVLTRQPQRHVDIVQVRADLRIVHQLEISARRAGKVETRAVQQTAEQVALGLVKGRQLINMLGVPGHEVGQGTLQRRHATEVDVLVHFAQLGAQGRRRDHVTGLPAGNVVRLAEGTDHEGT